MNKQIQQDDLTLKDLNQFHGTERYYNVMGFNVTDGINYITKNGYSWFVTDFLSVALCKKEVKQESFICIKLKLLDDNKAKMFVTDGNDKIIYKQEYNYTNVKKELTLYFIDKVLLLSSEY